MGETHSSCLLGIMDRLWFHQIILLSEPINTSLYATKILNHRQINSDSSTPPLLPLQVTQTHHQLTQQENLILKPSSPITSLENPMKNEEYVKERPTRKDKNSVRSRARSHSSSPMAQKRPRKHLKQVKLSLQKSSSCRSFEDLEMEEVKGFMDLGFVFKKSNLSPKLIRVVPGLQRLGIYHEYKQSTCDDTISNDLTSSSSASSSFDDGEEEETKTSVIMRPYLSEAWLIKRPDSPLLNLRIPKVLAPADMKKHLRFWARTVASEVQYESWDERRFGLLSC